MNINSKLNNSIPPIGQDLPRNYEGMAESEMNSLLLGLWDTKLLDAIIRYTDIRNQLLTDSLRSLDPFKNPTEVARNQGMGVGLYDLLEYLKLLQERRKKEN